MATRKGSWANPGGKGDKDKAKDNKEGSKGWRGKSQSNEQVAKYRWQKDHTRAATDEIERQNRMHRMKVGGLVVSALVMLVVFIAVIYGYVEKTPFVAMGITRYDWPLPPNAWAVEDIALFNKLNNQNLDWQDISARWSSKELGLKHFDQQLADYRNSSRPAIIIYLSMHGAVNREGKACLIPPASPQFSTLDEKEWLPVSEILSHIKKQQLPDKLFKVLILDCNRMDHNWGTGILQNRFADVLEDAVNSEKVPNLAVINSTSPGQLGWSSPELRGSVFGRYVYYGLKGAADGNQDGRVSLRELHRYLALQVNQWTSENRSASQTPSLIYPSTAPDFELTVALKSGLFSAGDESPVETKEESSDRNTASKDIDALWVKHDEVLANHPHRFAPLRWRDFEHSLLHAEKLLMSGSAYQNQGIGLVKTLTKQITEIDAAGLTSSLPENKKVTRVTTSLPAHSLPLAAHFGRPLDTGYTGKVMQAWQSVQTPRGPEIIQQLVSGFGRPERDVTPGLVEGQFLYMLSEHLDRNVWRDKPDLVAQAIQVRNLAEQAAADAQPDKRNRRLSDERVQYWCRTTVDAADQLLRQAEDNLFVGDGDSLGVAQGQWAEARARYQRSLEMSDAVADALLLRDEIWAELPYLAQWYTRDFPNGQKALADEFDTAVKDRLLPFILEAHAFANYLESTLPTSSLDAEPPADEFNEARADLQKRTKQLNTAFQQLVNEFDDRCNELVSKAGEDQRTMREIASVLNVPLVGALQRAKLRASYADIAKKLFDRQQKLAEKAAATEGEKLNIPDPNGPGSYRSRMAFWGEHPALVLVEPAARAELQQPPPKAGLEIQGGWIRDVLLRLPVELKSVGGKLENLNNPGELEIRGIYNRTDRLARMLAGLASDSPDPEPSVQLRRLDLRHLLLWQARRTIDDCWGPPAGEEVSFFDPVASAYLQWGREVWRSEIGISRQFEPEHNRLQTRRLAVKKGRNSGLRAQAPPLLLTGEETEIRHSITPIIGENYPTGRAAIFLWDNTKKEGLDVETSAKGRLHRLGLNIVNSTNADALQYSLRPQELTSPSIDSVALFRGHRYPSPVPMSRIGGEELLLVRELPPPAPTVVVKGRAKELSTVMLILDCSFSMNAKTGLEATSPTRMAVAIDALRTLLDELNQAGQYQVGVMFYGHRVGWNTKNTTSLEVLFQTKYGDRIPSNLKPYEDVQTVLSLGRFGAREKTQVLNLLDTVEGWGETPLYYSLVQALREFKNDDTQKSIVVITDGRNQVFQPPADKNIQKDDVLKARGNRDIAIYTVGFKLDAAKPDDREAVQEFQEIASKTGGKYLSADSASELIRTLRETVQPTRYEVVKAGDNRGETKPIPQSLTISPAPVHKTRYTVKVSRNEVPITAELELAGGEGIELYLTEGARRLEHARYNEGRPVASGPIRDPASDQSFRLFAHRPDWRPIPGFQTPVVTFLISLQNDNEKLFSPKPQEVWMEITPLIEGVSRRSTRYRFSDVNYENGKPVPVLQFPIPSWPADARKAEISAVWKYQQSKPDLEMTVGQAMDQSGTKVRLGDDDVTYKVRTLRGDQPGTSQLLVVVSGRHVEDLKIDTDVAALSISHRVDRVEVGESDFISIGVHKFNFPNVDEATLRNYKLLFITQEALKAQSLYLDRPITIDVPGPGGVL